MAQYLDFLGPMQVGANLMATRQNLMLQRERSRLEAQRFLEDTLQARALEDYRNRDLSMRERIEGRTAEQYARELERERRFNELYTQNINRFTGGPARTTQTWGTVGSQRMPTWQEQQDSFTRAALESGNPNLAAGAFASRAREELAAQEYQNRVTLANIQNQNRIELEKIKQQAALERMQVNRASDPRLGYFNVVDEMSGDVKGRVYFGSVEERDRWMKTQGMGSVLQREGGEPATEGEPDQYEASPDIESLRKEAEQAIKMGASKEAVRAKFKQLTGQDY